MESLKNATYKKRILNYKNGNKTKVFIKSLQISPQYKAPPHCTQISARLLMCCADLIKSLFSLNKLHSCIIHCRRTFKLAREVLKTLSFK